MKICFALIVCSFLSVTLPILAQPQCGSQAGGKVCPGGLCCSEWGYCGSTDAYCGAGCQTQCGLQLIPNAHVDEVISKQVFSRMILLPANDDKPNIKLPFCPGKQSWPELVGKNGQEAAAIIEQENPYVNAIVLKEGTPVTRDLRCDRVWVWVNDEGIVVSTPIVT